VNIESLLPSARPKFTEFAFEVVKPGSLWRLREMDKFYLLPVARRTRINRKKTDHKVGDPGKIDPVEWWWI
jgi:hypothetical protein